MQDAALGSSFNATTKRDPAKRYLNIALAKLGRFLRYPESAVYADIPVDAGDNSILLPGNVVRLRGDAAVNIVAPNGDLPLEWWTIDELNAAGAAFGQPLAWAQHGEQILLYPTPAAAATARVYFVSTFLLMSDDDDEPTLAGGPQILPRTEEFDDTLVQYARARLYGDEDDDQAMTTWLAMFEASKRDLARAAGMRTNMRRQVPSMWARSSAPSFRRP